MRRSQREFSLVSLIILVATLAFASPLRAESPAPAAKPLTAAQLEQLVAPIALYPDDLLSQVLMASTYPLEVVEAARWSRDNPKVTGQALEDAMQKQDWDPSVKALTAVPQTLQMMNDQLGWMQDLGDAFLAQQEDVFTAVQSLRARADAAGNLKSTPEQKVTRVNRPANVSAKGAPTTAYEIVPANPNQYYVPVYDPAVVYGAWPYPAYAPPFYWYPPGYVAAGVFGFAAGVFTGAAIWGGMNWWNRSVNVNVNRYNQFNRTNISNSNWSHNASHRRGVPYNNPQVASRFGDQGRGKARDSARQNLAQGGKGQGGMGQGGKGQGGMGQGGKGQGGMGQGGKGQGGMAGGGMDGGGMAGGGMGQGGMAGGGGMAASIAGGGMGGGGMGLSGGGMGFSGGGMAGGGMAGGGRGGGGRGGGGRRSDIELKEDVTLLGHLANGIGFYRFVYKGSDTAYVGVVAQEVRRVRPDAVARGRDGYLRVFYDKLGLKFKTYSQWLAAGAQVPVPAR
jgi:Protein of unknown function (DUF3300)/Chaperone of endosialidase